MMFIHAKLHKHMPATETLSPPNPYQGQRTLPLSDREDFAFFFCGVKHSRRPIIRVPDRQAPATSLYSSKMSVCGIEESFYGDLWTRQGICQNKVRGSISGVVF